MVVRTLPSRFILLVPVGVRNSQAVLLHPYIPACICSPTVKCFSLAQPFRPGHLILLAMAGRGPATNYGGTRTYGSSVILPLTPANGYTPKIFIMGGGSPATSTTELIDVSATNPTWVYGPSMVQPRIEMNATILPNGLVLTSGGSQYDEDKNTASLKAELYDPTVGTTGAFSSAGSNAFARLYHSNSILLPDATVLLAGSNPSQGTYDPHMEVYSPPYLFNVNGTLATRRSLQVLRRESLGTTAPFKCRPRMPRKSPPPS